MTTATARQGNLYQDECMQAMDRAHRIGQKKEVQVFRFCVESSIEEKVIEKAYKKLRLDALVIQQGRLTDNAKTVNKDDLLNMVRYGAEKVFSSEVPLPLLSPFLSLCALMDTHPPPLSSEAGSQEPESCLLRCSRRQEAPG